MSQNQDSFWQEPRARRRLLIVLVVIILVAAVAVVGAVLATRSGGNQPVAPGSPGGTSTSAPAPGTSGASPSTTNGGSPTGSATPPAAPAFGYQPLWPFAGVADARDWQQSYRSGGHQPWHLDAGQVALAFTQGYLGYANVDKVVGTSAAGDATWVSVGFDNPNGQPVTAAVLHLVRISTGSDAPWEVVGTKDSTLSLTKPRYGSTVRSPVTVGGRITGVDENVTVAVHELDLNTLVGQSSGVPAGGDNAPWSTTVFMHPVSGSVLTIAASTGGHVAAVERFAVTGVRAG